MKDKDRKIVSVYRKPRRRGKKMQYMFPAEKIIIITLLLGHFWDNW